jgi:hypothetical protein
MRRKLQSRKYFLSIEVIEPTAGGGPPSIYTKRVFAQKKTD